MLFYYDVSAINAVSDFACRQADRKRYSHECDYRTDCYQFGVYGGFSAPMAVLVATLMAFGKFSELNELTALRASGINPIQIILPVLVAAFVLGFGLIWFSNNVLPEANSKARSLFMDIRVKKPGFDLKPNVFYNGIEGYTFLVREIDNETDSLYNVTLFQDS